MLKLREEGEVNTGMLEKRNKRAKARLKGSYFSFSAFQLFSFSAFQLFSFSVFQLLLLIRW